MADPNEEQYLKDHFYEKDLPEDIGAVREKLTTYSHIPADEVDEHVRRIRERLWVVAKYRCIGRWRFLDTHAVDSPGFQLALKRLQAPGSQDVLLDMACCVGQVVRRLVWEGVDSERLLGADLQQGFLDIGYDLFRDRDTLKSTFVAGDVFDDNDPGLAKIRGKPTLIHAQAFFHLFDYPTQVAAAVALVNLLRPGVKDAIIFGQQFGSPTPQEIHNIRGGTRFAHDPNSFQRMWDEVGEKTGTKWKVEGTLRPRRGREQRRIVEMGEEDEQGDDEERKIEMGSFQFMVRQIS